jgi:hypothetical protein
MDYKLINSHITDDDIERKLFNKLKLDEFEKDKEYDITVEFYNDDLIDDSLNDDISYEIKKSHYVFIKKIRKLFEYNKIKIKKFNLMGTILDLRHGELEIEILKSNTAFKKNIIWPCKEIFIFENGKIKLENLLFTNQITMEEYESNLEDLKYELSIFESDEEHQYIN